jgi:hypothetical protein
VTYNCARADRQTARQRGKRESHVRPWWSGQARDRAETRAPAGRTWTGTGTPAPSAAAVGAAAADGDGAAGHAGPAVQHR